MRLGDVLSKSPKNEYVQVEGFLQNKKGIVGQQVDLNVGKVMLNYFCTVCDDVRTFTSKGKLRCIFVNERIISVDCVLSCGCSSYVQAWFLIECDDNICGQAPKIRIIKRSEKLSDLVKIYNELYGEFSLFIEKAELAFRDGLGAGSIVYLRKAFEKITVQIANSAEIEFSKYPSGNPKNFRNLLEKVDEKCSIVPKEFSNNGYKLFSELSNVVHGDYDEDLGLEKYEPLHRLVIGILENVRNSKELQNASNKLGWGKVGVEQHDE